MITGGAANIIGTINSADLNTGNITATGSLTAPQATFTSATVGSLQVNGAITTESSLTSSGEVTVGSLVSNGTINSTGPIYTNAAFISGGVTAANLTTSGGISADNISVGQVNAVGNIVTTGGVTAGGQLISNGGRQVKITTYSSSSTISTNDHVIIFQCATDAMTLTLPSSPSQGQQYYIKVTNNDNSVAGPCYVGGGNIIDLNGNHQDQSITLTVGQAICLVWAQSYSSWLQMM